MANMKIELPDFYTENDIKNAFNDGYVAGVEAAQPKWISVEERLPENEETVLAVTKHSFHTHNGIREITTVSAVFHTDGKTFSGDSKYNFDEGDVYLIYDEDNDEYIVPEGWWESTYFTEQFAAVDEEVLYWMPLPEPPKEET